MRAIRSRIWRIEGARLVSAMRWIGLVALVGLMVSGCRRQPLGEEAVHEALSEKREQYQTDIERGVQSAPPPIVVSEPSSSSTNRPQTPSSTPQGGGVPPYEAPPPTLSNPSAPSTTPNPPADTRAGDVQLDPRTGQYGIAPPGAPEGYTIPLNNAPATTPSGSP
jgi:hypothetical protein